MFQTDRFICGIGFFIGEHITQVPADHQRDNLVLCIIRDRSSRNILAIPQDGEVVADLFQLIKPMGNVDDGFSLAAQITDDLKQFFDLVVRQHIGGFVHHDEVHIQ